MRLHLIRHPQPQVEPGICYGSTDLPAIAGEPERVFKALRNALRSEMRGSTGLPPEAPIYSSPLRRCAALAILLGEPIFDARLRELHFGDWEMRRWDDIPRAGIDAWAADMAHYHPGDGESAAAAAQRVLDFRAAVLQQPHTDAIIVCHAGTIRLLLAYEPGMTPAQTALRAAQAAHRIGYGAMVTVEGMR